MIELLDWIGVIVSESQEKYTWGHAPSVLRAHAARSVEDCFAYGLKYLSCGMTVLDLGCGPGTITTGIAKAITPGRVIAVDLDPGVLEQARDHARSEGVDNIDFRVMDAYGLDLPDDSIDLVHAHQVLHHMSDPVAVLRELARVTRPGGKIAVRDSIDQSFTWYPESKGVENWQRYFGETVRANGGDPDAGMYHLAWAHAAGLTEVMCTSSTWTYSGPSVQWWADMWAERLTDSSMAAQIVAECLATEEDLLNTAQALKDWATHPDAWLMVPCGEIVATVPQ